MLRMLTRTVAASGFEVASFSSAEDLLDSGRISESTCLILDVDLPGISGLELQEKLNMDGEPVPLILISGQTTEATRQRALRDGAIAFFNEPFNISALVAALRSVQFLALV